MFIFLIKAVPAHKRLRVVVGLLILFFVVSLFMVDLDSDQESLSDQTDLSMGSSPSEMESGGSGDTSSIPSALAQLSHNKVATGYKYKVFLYEDDLPKLIYGDLKRDTHCQNEYSGVEALFPQVLKKLDVYTRFGDIADYYVVPVMTECFLSRSLLAGKDFNRAVNELNSLFETTLDEIQSSYPYWSRTEGRDHIFIFPSERGPSLLNEGNMLRIKKSIFLTGLTVYKPSVFEPWKDIVVPAWRTNGSGVIPAAESNSTNGTAAPAASRDIFVHFRGTVPGLEDKQPSGLTHELQKAVNDSSTKMKGKVVFKELDDEVDVMQEMLRSTFCLCPGGDFEGWSLRLYRAISAGCIPVIVADNVELPFVQLVDYSKFSVKILEKDSLALPKLLNEIKEERIRGKQKAIEKIADRFSWTYFTEDSEGKSSWKPSTALDSLLHILHLKLRFMRNSPYHFWLKEET